MGIVVSCPSGHRMKVKDYLAGKKGICPTCGARFRIPVPAAQPAATAPAPQPMPAAAAAAEAAAPAVATIVSLDPADAVGLPELLLVATAAAGGLGDPASVDAPQVDPDPTADLQIDEDDDAGDVLYWYVAIPGGQPSAALREPEMLAWLGSGQATGREVVWRSDWPGWKPIGEAFPERFPAAFPGPGQW